MTTNDPTTAQLAELARFVATLDTFDAQPDAVRLRQDTYDLLQLRPGDAAADIGCGAGLAVAELADRGVAASGVDPEPGMVAVARQRHPAGEFHVATAENLPYGDGTLRGYRAEKVYHLVPDPAAALAEAHRVLAPGGRIVLAGLDWEGILIDADDMATTRALVTARLAAYADPHSVRRYRNQLRDAGFVDCTVTAYLPVFHDHALAARHLTNLATAGTKAGAVTTEQADAWLAEQEHRGRTDRLFMAVPMVVASARRP